MKTIIGLLGKPNVGKSTTMGILAELLIRNDYFIFKDKKKSTSKDFSMIFEKNQKKIGITAYGDTVPIIKERLGYFERNGCTIIVCAGREVGPIYDEINNYPGFIKVFKTKRETYEINKQATLNAEDAEFLFELIYKHVYDR